MSYDTCPWEVVVWKLSAEEAGALLEVLEDAALETPVWANGETVTEEEIAALLERGEAVRVIGEFAKAQTLDTLLRGLSRLGAPGVATEGVPVFATAWQQGDYEQIAQRGVVLDGAWAHHEADETGQPVMNAGLAMRYLRIVAEGKAAVERHILAEERVAHIYRLALEGCKRYGVDVRVADREVGGLVEAQALVEALDA